MPIISGGGGGTFNGGTVHGATTISPTNKDDVALTLAPVAGATADATDQLQVLNDSSNFILELDAAGNFFYTLRVANSASFRIFLDALTLLSIPSNGSGVAWRIPTGGNFEVADHGGNPALRISDATQIVQALAGIAGNPITSGALPTVAPVTATAFQCSTTRDVDLWVPVTYNPGVATTATCKVELSPDNVTFSTLATVTQPVGTVFDGSIEPVLLHVPAGWFVKLTVTNATLGTGTYY